jgi:hypothetical protein
VWVVIVMRGLRRLLCSLLLLFPATMLAQTAAAPIFSPAGAAFASPATYASAQYVTMTSATSGATIHWGYSGSASCTPTETYSTPVYVDPTAGAVDTICAYATASGVSQSATTTESYVISTGTLATGDSRTVNQPPFPLTCSKFSATKYIVSTTSLDVNPYNPTCGSVSGTNGTLGCTGGTSLEPSSTASPTFTSAETDDNTAFKAALTACPSGHAVELIPGSSGQMAIVLGSIVWPTGVSVILDPGTTVYASRNPADFGGGDCGTIPTGKDGTSCSDHWITAPGTSGIGFYGFGMFNGRGWDKAYGNSAASGWYYNRVQSYCSNHGKAELGSPACTPTTGASGIAYGPDAFHLKNANNVTFYGVWLIDADNFNLYWGDSSNGLTVWDMKIMSPFEVSNSDGIDPSYAATDATIANSFISVGDNHMALKSDNGGSYTAGLTSNISVLNIQTGAGIAITVGADTLDGVSNFLVDGFRQKGNPNNTQSAGFGIDTSATQGGVVHLVTFENGCVTDENKTALFSAFYAGGSANPPTMTDVTVQDVHALNGAATGNSGEFIFQGYSASYLLGLTLNNVVADGTIPSSTGNEYANVNLGPDPVSANIQCTLNVPSTCTTGSGLTVTNNVTTTNAAYPCTTTTWQPLVGDLVLNTSTANNQSTFSGASPATYTLQAVIHPATDVSSKESPAIASPVTFYDNGSVVGTAPLSANGTLASLSLSGVTAGTHVYTAGYSDSNYPAYTFGNVTTSISGTEPTVATPTIAPVAGSYSSSQTLTITSATSGATIYYTTNGTTPTTASTLYSAPFTLSSSATVKAIAVKTDFNTSAVATSSYTLGAAPTAATPAFTPVAGTYTSIQNVTLTDATSGAQIYYTLDGSTPTTSSTLYGGGIITVSVSLTIKALAVETGYNNSAVGSAAYVINIPPPAALNGCGGGDFSASGSFKGVC